MCLISVLNQNKTTLVIGTPQLAARCFTALPRIYQSKVHPNSVETAA